MKKKCVTWWSECVMWYRHVSCDVSSACLTVSGHIFIVFKSLKMWNSGTLFEKRACLTVYHTDTRLVHTLCQSKIMVDAEWTLKKFIFSNRKLILIFFALFFFSEISKTNILFISKPMYTADFGRCSPLSPTKYCAPWFES